MSGVITLLLCLLAYAFAQTTAPPSTTAVASQSTVSLWLPMGGIPESAIQASILFASPNATAYVLGCPANATLRYCDRNPPITVTEGVSTVSYTNTFFRNSGTVRTVEKPLTVKCELVGAILSVDRGATSAVCSVSSEVIGLGMKVSTTVLASSEIEYRPVTLTGGIEKLRAAEATATNTDEPAASTGGAAAPTEITAMVRLGLSGVALGLLALANV